MRPLTDDETKTFFEKLAEYIGRNIKNLLERSDEPERLLRTAVSIAREDLVSVGTNFGKFTKSGKFHLKITCLDYLAEHAKFKVWVKPSAEMSFLYGNDVPKSGIARMTEAIPQYAGVVVFSLSNTPLGFGRANRTTEQVKDLEPATVVVLHQADIGEYLRTEEELA